ncbi:MAG: acyl carrier protein [bacterium]
MESEVKEIMARIFEVPVEEIEDDSSPDTIESWDSLHHLNLILALEEKYQVTFSEEEIAELLNFQLIIMSLKEKGVA